MPPPDSPTQEYPEAQPIESRVRELLEKLESGHESHREWLVLNSLYRDLSARKQSPRVRNLMGMIEPILGKYGYHKVASKNRES